MSENKKEKKYTEDELNHIIASRVAKIQMGNLESRVSRNESSTIKGFSEIAASIDSLTKLVQNSSDNLHKCKDELKDEVEKDFVNKEIFQLEMSSMDKKIDDQWKRITLAVTVAFATIQFAFKLWGG